MKEESVLKSFCRSGATLTSNKECSFVLRQVSPDLHFEEDANFMSGLHLTYKQHGGFTLFPAPISRIRPYGEYRDDERGCKTAVIKKSCRPGRPLAGTFRLFHIIRLLFLI